MDYQIEITFKKGYRDRHGEHVYHDCVENGITGINGVSFLQVYRISGDVISAEIEGIASHLLTDPVNEIYTITPLDAASKRKAPVKGRHEVEVWLKHGVTDTVAESVLKAVRDLGNEKEMTVKTGQKYVFSGKASPGMVRQIVERLLVNPMIQEYTVQ
jgi:phosphoribosylformylglycinamidine synthase